MTRQLLLVFALAVSLLAPSPLLGSDGDLTFLAEIPGTGGGRQGLECNIWQIKWRSSSESEGKPKFGICRPPVIKVYATLVGASAVGITGVEFSAKFGEDDFPEPGYLFIEIPNPTASIVLGRAFSPPDPRPRGMNITWSFCQAGSGGRVLLETVLVIPLAPCGPSTNPPSLKIKGGQRSVPTNDYFRCPLFTLCDTPAFTKVCLGDNIEACPAFVIPGCEFPPNPPCPLFAKCSTSGQFSINVSSGHVDCLDAKSGAPREAPSTVVDSWSQVKSLYR